MNSDKTPRRRIAETAAMGGIAGALLRAKSLRGASVGALAGGAAGALAQSIAERSARNSSDDEAGRINASTAISVPRGLATLSALGAIAKTPLWKRAGVKVPGLVGASPMSGIAGIKPPKVMSIIPVPRSSVKSIVVAAGKGAMRNASALAVRGAVAPGASGAARVYSPSDVVSGVVSGSKLGRAASFVGSSVAGRDNFIGRAAQESVARKILGAKGRRDFINKSRAAQAQRMRDLREETANSGPKLDPEWGSLDHIPEGSRDRVLKKLRHIQNLKHSGATEGERQAAMEAMIRVKKAHNLSARESLDSIIQFGGAWTRKEGKSKSGGLNEKGRKSYERENPGSDLKAPSKEAGNPRRASFCARMKGMKKKLTSSKTASDPDSRINKSLRAWNCSARESLGSIINFADPRPRNSLGMFSGAEGGVDPEAIGAVYKQGGQMAQQEEGILASLARKLKGKKIRMSAREELGSIVEFGFLDRMMKKVEDAAPAIQKKIGRLNAWQEQLVTGKSAFPRVSKKRAEQLYRDVAGGKLPDNLDITAVKGGSHFSPGAGGSGSSLRASPTAEVIAHEAGHARQARIARAMSYRAAKKAGLPARQAIAAANNAPAAVFAGTNFAKKIPTKTKTGAVLASLPNLAIEADASRRAVQHLGRDAVPALARAWATYAAGAAHKIRNAGKVEMSARESLSEIITLGVRSSARKAWRGFWHGESAEMPAWADAMAEKAARHPLTKVVGVDVASIRDNALATARQKTAEMNRKILGWSVIPPAIQYGISKRDSNKSEKNIIAAINQRKHVALSARDQLNTIMFGAVPGVVSRGYKAATRGGPKFKSSVSMPTVTKPINPAAREMPAREYSGPQQPAKSYEPSTMQPVNPVPQQGAVNQPPTPQPKAMSGPSWKYRMRGWRGAAVAGAAGVGVGAGMGYAMRGSGASNV